MNLGRTSAGARDAAFVVNRRVSASRTTAILAGLTFLAVFLAGGQEVVAQVVNPGKVSASATLSVLTGTVRYVPVGSEQPQPAEDGTVVKIGDRVLTGAKSFAVITFLDGSTLVVCPDTDVTLKQADVADGKRAGVAVRINLGLVWARVKKLISPKPNFSLQANTVVASTHDGLIGAKQNEDGSFECWSSAGEVTIEDRVSGQPPWTFSSGQKIVLGAGQAGPASPKPFAVNQSAIRITTSANALPLLLMAEKARVAGFAAPGIEVNQVLGSLTAIQGDGSPVIQVPAGVAGPFTLVLEGSQDGPFKVEVAGLYQGNQVYKKELTGTIKKGERLRTEITQQLEQATPADPKTAKVLSGTAGPLESLAGQLPGKILQSPYELQAMK